MTNDLLYIQHYESPIGLLGITASTKGLRAIELDPTPSSDHPNSVTKSTIKQLQAYFNKESTTFDIPLDSHGTEFEQKVWAYLTTIPFGSTCTYSDIARQVSTIKAVRAVGKANGKNPIPIIVPCHRVIGADGSLTGYALGLDVKLQLLKLEMPHRYAEQLSLF